MGALAFSIAPSAKPLALPEQAPVPQLHRPAPERLNEAPARPDAKKAPAPGKGAVEPDPRSAIMPEKMMPAAEIACRARLKALQVVFEEHAPEVDPARGCSVPYPVVVKKLGASVELLPPAELNCAMAEASAHFMRDSVLPVARELLKANVTAVHQASAFVCRPRHDGSKISEHAFGNALDIVGFTLNDGTRVDVGPDAAATQARFLARLRAAACGPFKTVLGPGSDAAHDTHFHFDLEPRRNGTFCQ